MSEETIENSLPIDIPEPPFPLQGRATVFWNELYSQLAEIGNIERTDLFMLARYCDGLEQWEKLTIKFRTENIYKELVGPKGNIYLQKDPELTQLDNLNQNLPRLERALCIGAQARKTTPVPKDTDETLKKLLSRGK